MASLFLNQNVFCYEINMKSTVGALRFRASDQSATDGHALLLSATQATATGTHLNEKRCFFSPAETVVVPAQNSQNCRNLCIFVCVQKKLINIFFLENRHFLVGVDFVKTKTTKYGLGKVRIFTLNWTGMFARWIFWEDLSYGCRDIIHL